VPKVKPEKLIDLRQALKGPFGALTAPLVERMLGVHVLNRDYRVFTKVLEAEKRKMHLLGRDGQLNFWNFTLEALDVTYEISEEDLARIPKEGPVLVVANHPMGGIEGIILGAVLTNVRPDALLLANYLLAHIPEIRPWLITVDPFGGKDAAKANLRGIRQAIQALREGQMVGTFPSGTVSHWNWEKRQVTDPLWSPTTAKLVHAGKATVLPIYFSGQNRFMFQALGTIHPRLRTAMLPREMLNKRGKTLRLKVGNPIPYRQLKDYESNEALTEFLRLKTYILKGRTSESPRKVFPVPRLRPRIANKVQQKPLAPAVPKESLKAEVAGLSKESQLVRQGDLTVYAAKAGEIPFILEEIGRLREKTFREVQEGTGEATDLDRFDQYYWHLFLWDEANDAIAGAYRIGRTEEIIRTHGRHGLYSSTLFKYKPAFLDELGPALELGRSFIIPEYQRKRATLSLLWRGICAFVLLDPRYTVLFGPVSISQEYNTISRDMIVQFLRWKSAESVLSRMTPLVKPRKPPKRKIRGAEREALFGGALRDIDDVSAIISEIEMDRKGVPTLLKHYLRMSGQIISFNIDPDFGQCLDGLIVVDFLKSDPRLLRAYMGAEGIQQFYAFHGLELDALEADAKADT